MRMWEKHRVAFWGCLITIFTVRECQMMPASEAAWALDREDIAGYGYFEVDTGRAGCRGLAFEDGFDALANGSVRPALFPGTKHPSACEQLEGRLGTQNDRGHLASSFILPQDPLGPPSDPGGPHCLPRLSLLSGFKNFGGLQGHCITCVVSQLAQTTYSVIKIVNNERRGDMRCS